MDRCSQSFKTQDKLVNIWLIFMRLLALKKLNNSSYF
jgi:hypothetical protein